MTASGEAAGLVNKDGKSSEAETVPVEGGAAKVVALQFDHPGTIPVNFKYRVGSSEVFNAAGADSVVVNNTGMTTARTFGIAGGARETVLNVTPLYPFTSPYTIYAGSCAANNPNPEGKPNPPSAPAIANVVAPAGGTATAATIQLPALNLTVSYAGKPLSGARVTVTDKSCKDSKGSSIKRDYHDQCKRSLRARPRGLAEPGFPGALTKLCVSTRSQTRLSPPRQSQHVDGAEPHGRHDASQSN